MLAMLLALGTLAPVVPMDGLEAGATYRVHAALPNGFPAKSRARVMLEGAGGERIAKALHAGDPDITFAYRPTVAGPARLVIDGEATASWSRLNISAPDSDRIEAEPNDSWRMANPLTLGRDVHGSGDDVDYLDNPEEGRSGLDWFRLEIAEDGPILATFQLDLLDRDVSANLRLHVVDEAGNTKPFEMGKDPTEVIHDRERERYSTYITRTLTRGTYYLEVNANHPAYILRSRRRPVPPLADPGEAVAIGSDYLLDAGDAWFAQIPREGHRYTRAANLHETATRCTACHASSYPTEAALVAQRNGYPIRSKASMASLIERLANSPTPLYGDGGLNWQRFIAIPLQAQGKQGGILADFDAQVSGRETPAFERFAPFLRAAWSSRAMIPGDEQNGVVPADSKFALLWRDWRVLELAARRTGRIAYARASDNIADILGDPETDQRVETFQDRLHRLHAWQTVDPDRYARRIEDEVDALFALQNEDGGWHELGRKPARSAIYATGQVAWTLLRAGARRDDPRIRKALRFLLDRQQPFGGWFQADTHENFRTPMRETRYAVEALAEGFPRPGPALNSWGNRDGGPPRSPRPGPIVPLLDDLDNLWDVPEADRPRMTAEIAGFLDHAEPLVRASAASCLGRVGGGEAVGPLIARLGDPSKIVGRAAAWALRSLGNRGLGVDAIAEALDDPDPAVRRGTTRIFSAQFHGMDGRIDIADRLTARTRDADLWTRLQALRSLRQWFYRTNDDGLRRRIVDAYLAAMSVPDEPVIRRALIEGMYILLDENLGGGVSLQKNLAALPEAQRASALKGREDVERAILLGPILDALEAGDPLRRDALIRSFDGSFLKGRSFARRPEGMLDVGNDREFGFLHEPDPDRLDRIFAILLSPTLTMESETRSRAIRLACFFRVVERTANPAIQMALLQGLTDPDDGIRAATREAVANDLGLIDAEDHPDLIGAIIDRLRGPAEVRSAVAAAVGRNPSLLDRDDVRAVVRSLMQDDPSGLVPVLGHRSFDDEEVLTAIARAWATTPEARDRSRLLDALFARPWLLDRPAPAEDALRIIRLGMADPSASIRERALNTSFEWGRFRDGRAALGFLVASLADEAPSVRRLALGLASSRPGFWDRPDAVERLRSLLIDPDFGVRDRALSVVERLRLVRGRRDLALRVRALSGDPALGTRADAALRDQGFDPAGLVADAFTARMRPLGLSKFRDEVDPWLTRPGPDGTSCVQCHSNHAVFRLAAPDPARGITEASALMMNYASATRVIQLADPESSLLLRKPRSPQGQGAADPSSPTGLTHAGGTRWDDPDHPAYGAALGWIRAASAASVGEDRYPATSDNHAPGHEPGLALDGDLSTIWQTEFIGATPGYPHDLTIDLRVQRTVRGLVYVPRQDSPIGRVKDFEISVSEDGRAWHSIVRGAWPDDPAPQPVAWPGRFARFVRLRGLGAVDGGPSMAAAEVAIDAAPTVPMTPGQAEPQR
ncbi:discoidin domain-containing protein [Tundrisphaera sp. TA3]|uniref:discoidin domain-containing protein n=1 Tax=Tundrisphaera sp. TA3 TaxID=3435775 RepID=UPI003EBDBF15